MISCFEYESLATTVTLHYGKNTALPLQLLPYGNCL
jgi:hypothetical protein